MNTYVVKKSTKRFCSFFQLLLNACLVLTVLLLYASECWGFRNLKVGEPVPDFELKDIDGNTYSLSKLKGKTVLILYWRVGQDRSEEALKELETLSLKFSGQPIQILAITKNFDKISEIKSLIKSLGLSFPLLLDEKAKVYSGFGVIVFPSTALIDKKGVSRYHHYGGFRGDYHEELSGQIRLALGLITKEELKKE